MCRPLDLPPIECLVCEKKGNYGDGFILAANRIGGYACSKACDDIILAYDAEKKAQKLAEKKKK